jgi:hypothetical protein
MQSVTLSPELAFVLSAEAKRSGKTLTALVEEWLRQQYQTLRREQLALQTRKFWANHATLYAQYPNQYVAFYDDEVLDQLALRVRAQHGNLPIVIAQVTPEPITSYQMRSPRLQQELP